MGSLSSINLSDTSLAVVAYFAVGISLIMYFFPIQVKDWMTRALGLAFIIVACIIGALCAIVVGWERMELNTTGIMALIPVLGNAFFAFQAGKDLKTLSSKMRTGRKMVEVDEPADLDQTRQRKAAETEG